MPEDSPILKRIKALLRLSASANPHEAQLALAKALELANAHHISLRDVDPTNEQARPTHVESKSWSKIPLEVDYAAQIVKKFFHVRPIAVQQWEVSVFADFRWHYKLVGLPHDVAIAEYIFGFLIAHFRRSWNQRKNRRLRNRRNFLWGMFLGLRTKLSENQPPAPPPEETAITLSVDSYIKEHIGETSSKALAKKGDTAGTLAGFREGRETQIHDALHASGKAPLALQG